MTVTRLEDYAEYLSRGKSPRYVDKSDVMVINQACIYWNGIQFDKVKYHNEEVPYKKALLQNGDVLINSTGTGTLGRAAVFYNNSNNKYIADSHVTIFRCNENLFPEFVKYYLESSTTQNRIYKECVNGSTNQIELSKEKISNMQIEFPDLHTQRHIADTLDKVSEGIEVCRRMLGKLDLMVKAKFQEMVGDFAHNPLGWEKGLLGTICDVRDGTHDSPNYYETGYPLVTSKNVTGGKIDLAGCSLICKADFEKINERSKVDMGDIIMPMIGTIGKPVIVNIEPNFCIKNVALIKFKNNSTVSNTYIHNLLQTDYFNKTIIEKVRGGTQKFISLGDIRKLEILVPPMKTQNKFADFVSQINKTKLTIQKILDKMEMEKLALMQEYFL